MKTKVIIALIALFGCAIQLFASDPLVVDKLIHKATDLSASNAPKDMNGNSCGLLKVITTDKSMTFEGSVVGTPEYKNGEYWVYLPSGTYQIRIKASSKMPIQLNFKDYNITIVEPKATYELTFRQNQDTSTIYLSNAYSALNSGKLSNARDFYEKYKEISGRSDALFEMELAKTEGTYIWSDRELIDSGFKLSNYDIDNFNYIDNYEYVSIPIKGADKGYIESAYRNSKIVDGNTQDGYVNGLTLFDHEDTYELAYVCMGKVMAPSISVIKSPMMIVEWDENPYKNTLFINETVVANEFDIYTMNESDMEWIPYVKKIFGPNVINQKFFYNFTLGKVDMAIVKRQFSNFVKSGEKIPEHLWGYK